MNLVPFFCMSVMSGVFLIVLNGFIGKREIVKFQYLERPPIGPDSPPENQNLMQLYSGMFDVAPIATKSSS